MQKNKRQYLLKSFGKSGVYPILVEVLDEIIALRNENRLSGDLLSDIPSVYKREGAIQELRRIKSLLKTFKKEYETMQESLDDDQADMPVDH